MSPLFKPILNWEFGTLARNPDPEVFEKSFVKAMSGKPEKDRRCLDIDFVRKGLVEAMREAFVQDGRWPSA